MFQRQGRARRYLWSHCRTTSPNGLIDFAAARNMAAIDQPAIRLITLWLTEGMFPSYMWHGPHSSRIASRDLWYAEKAGRQKAAITTAELFSAQLSDKLRQSQSFPDDMGGLWAHISHSLRAATEAVVGFEWHYDECLAASAAKNDAYKRTLQSAATRAIGRREGNRDALSDARRGSRKGMSVMKSRCTGVETMLRNFSKTSSSFRMPNKHTKRDTLRQAEIQ